MDCRETLESLHEYLDDQEAAELCRQIQLHLQNCKNCSVYVDSVKKTIYLYQQLPHSQTPVTVSAQLKAALSKEYGSQPPRQELRAAD